MLARETGLCLRLLRLLGASAGRWTPLSRLAREMGISRAYAAKLSSRLRRAGFLEGRQGVGGGVRARTELHRATLLDLASALEDPFVVSHCLLAHEPCDPGETCPMHTTWEAMHGQVLEALRSCPLLPDDPIEAKAREFTGKD